MKLITRCWKF